MEKIDNLDKQILEIIMKNARIASKDVAVKCVSPEQPSTSVFNASST